MLLRKKMEKKKRSIGKISLSLDKLAVEIQFTYLKSVWINWTLVQTARVILCDFTRPVS